MIYPKGTTLSGLGLKLTLEDTELTTPPGSCAGDEFLYHWRTSDDRSHLTTHVELASLLADGATLNY
jgi:hypothetical protein